MRDRPQPVRSLLTPRGRTVPLVETFESRHLFAAVLDTTPATPAAAAPVATLAALTAGGYQSVSLGSWSSAASSPAARGDASVASVDGKVYVFGGLGDSSLLPKNRSVDVYDPATNKWKTGVGQTPVAFSHMGTAVHGDVVYFAGGRATIAGKRVEAIRNVWAYDVSDNTWTALPQLPKERTAGSMVVLNGELHYLGGSGSDTEHESASHFVLDLGDLSAGWRSETSMPGGRKRFGAAVVNGKIYVIGGHTGEENRSLKSSVWSWDPSEPGVWRSRASLPSARSHMPQSLMADPWGGILSVGGKTNSASASKDVLRYDPVSNRWTTLRSLPSGRNSALAALVGDTLVFTTGSSGGADFRRETWRATVRPA